MALELSPSSVGELSQHVIVLALEGHLPDFDVERIHTCCPVFLGR